MLESGNIFNSPRLAVVLSLSKDEGGPRLAVTLVKAGLGFQNRLGSGIKGYGKIPMFPL